NPLPKMVFGDLAVRVTAPAVLDGYQHLTTITVDNLDPYKTTPTVGGVSLVAYFTGVQPFVAQADSGFTCSIAKRETARWALSRSSSPRRAAAVKAARHPAGLAPRLSSLDGHPLLPPPSGARRPHGRAFPEPGGRGEVR